MKAANYKQLDQDYRAHQLAYLGEIVKATKKNGKPRYDTFDKFFDYEEQLAEITDNKKEEKKGRFDRLSRFLKEKEDG